MHLEMTVAELAIPKPFETGKQCKDGRFLCKLIISKCNFNRGLFALNSVHDVRVKLWVLTIKKLKELI